MIRIIIGSLGIIFILISMILSAVEVGSNIDFSAGNIVAIIVFMLVYMLPFIGLLLWGIFALRRAKQVKRGVD